MSLHVMVFLALLLPGVPQTEAALTDADVGRLAHELLVAAGANANLERAAFIVRTPTGTLDLLRWPGSDFFSAQWRGAVPEGVVAIIHTHPVKRPAPSEQDRAEAQRVGLPLYVVSRAGLCVAKADGEIYCAEHIPWLRRGGPDQSASLEWRAASAIS